MDSTDEDVYSKNNNNNKTTKTPHHLSTFADLYLVGHLLLFPYKGKFSLKNYLTSKFSYFVVSNE